MSSVRKILMLDRSVGTTQDHSVTSGNSFLVDDRAGKRRKLQCTVSESLSGESDIGSLTTIDQGTSASSARTAPIVSTYWTPPVITTPGDEVSKELQAAVLQDLLECNDDTDAHLQDWIDCEGESDLSLDTNAAASPGHAKRHQSAKHFEKLPVHVIQSSAPNATFSKASNFLVQNRRA